MALDQSNSRLRPHNQLPPSGFRPAQGDGIVHWWWETSDIEHSPLRQESSSQLDPSQQSKSGPNPPPLPPRNPNWLQTELPSSNQGGDSNPSVISVSPNDLAGQGPIENQPGPESLKIQRLELELAAARDEAAALHEMLEDLPEIFERKFKQRLQSIQEQQHRLLADNQALREQLYLLKPVAAPVEIRANRLLLPASRPSMTPLQTRVPLAETLRKVLRLGRPENLPEPSNRDHLD